MNLWTVGCADPRLTAPARSPMDKPGKTRCVSPTLPTGRRLPTSFTAPATTQDEFDFGESRNQQPANSLSLFSPEAVQTTGTVALLCNRGAPRCKTPQMLPPRPHAANPGIKAN